MITQEILKEFFTYNENTGLFTRIKPRGSNGLMGSIAGTLDKSTGYWKIKINDKSYRAHRLAWLYIYGYMPKNLIDHINGNVLDNRINNLREATRTQNIQNVKCAQKDNKLGFLGVLEKDGKFVARITTNRKVKHLGTFKTPELAHEAYIQAKRQYHEFCTI